MWLLPWTKMHCGMSCFVHSSHEAKQRQFLLCEEETAYRKCRASSSNLDKSCLEDAAFLIIGSQKRGKWIPKNTPWYNDAVSIMLHLSRCASRLSLLRGVLRLP
jgi:hypothetical protein